MTAGPLERFLTGPEWRAYCAHRWGERWAIARNTPRNRARWGRCITAREYQAAEDAFRAGARAP